MQARDQLEAAHAISTATALTKLLDALAAKLGLPAPPPPPPSGPLAASLPRAAAAAPPPADEPMPSAAAAAAASTASTPAGAPPPAKRSRTAGDGGGAADAAAAALPAAAAQGTGDMELDVSPAGASGASRRPPPPPPLPERSLLLVPCCHVAFPLLASCSPWRCLTSAGCGDDGPPLPPSPAGAAAAQWALPGAPGLEGAALVAAYKGELSEHQLGTFESGASRAYHSAFAQMAGDSQGEREARRESNPNLRRNLTLVVVASPGGGICGPPC